MIRDPERAPDPVRFEVVRNALTSVTEEMATALKRSAYSTNIRTRHDFSCAFFDRELRVTAQAFTQPVHLGSFVELVPRAVREYGDARLRPGDVIVTNDPYCGGVHLNDITMIMPAFFHGRARRLSRQSRSPLRCGRWRAGEHRGVSRGVSGRRDHPPGQGGLPRGDRGGRVSPDPGADPQQARDGGRPARAGRRERDRRTPAVRRVRPVRTPRSRRRHRCADRVHAPADRRGPGAVPRGNLPRGGVRRQRRVYRQPGAAVRDRDDRGGRHRV